MRRSTCVACVLSFSRAALGIAVAGLPACGSSATNSSQETSDTGGSAAEGGSTHAGNAGSGGTNTAGTGNGGSGGSRIDGGRSGTGGGSGGLSRDDGGAPTVDNTPSGTPPELTPGVWKNITPSGVNLKAGCCTHWPNTGSPDTTFGVTDIEIDPSNPYTLYTLVDVEGMWKSKDGGTSWTLVGTPPPMPVYATTVNYLDSPVRVKIDPRDPKHLIATQGVRGASLGFWVSTDGGDSWTQPPGFIQAGQMATSDVTTMVVDPSDFNHVLIGSHSPWKTGHAGILETRDGGQTFILHQPEPSWPGSGSLGLAFYDSPELKIGDSKTWLVSLDGDGVWRTTDSGDTWTQVTTLGAVHGGIQELYFTQDGTVYAGANGHILRGTDNGTKWDTVGPPTEDGYYQVIGDGNVLYAMHSNTGKAASGPGPFYTSSESDGVNWTPYQDGKQMFDDGPFTMRFDAVNGILYAANWDAGLWALKVLPPM